MSKAKVFLDASTLNDDAWEGTRCDGIQVLRKKPYKTLYRCTDCDYFTDRFDHGRNHFIRIHVRGHATNIKKRKFVTCNAAAALDLLNKQKQPTQFKTIATFHDFHVEFA
jgi:hypothetical protein